MVKNVLCFFAAVILLTLSSCGNPAAPGEKKQATNSIESGTALQASTAAPITPMEIIKIMGRGTNLGNTLETPNYEGEWGKAAEEHFFDAYKNAGYKTVRIPVRWDNFMGKTAPYTIDEARFQRVEQIVNWSLSRGFVTIINSHHDDWIKDDYQGNKERFKKMWEQIAYRFKDYPEYLLFEIINEPHGNITQNEVAELQSDCLDIIRVHNPTRITIITGPGWAHYTDLIYKTPVPNDPYLMATFHYYDPWSFAGEYQGTWGTASDIQHCEDSFQKVEDWAAQHTIPVLMGEFGVRREADRTSRLLWYDTIANKAIEHGFAFTVWDDDGWFQIYNRAANSWDQDVMDRIIEMEADTEAPSVPGVPQAVVDGSSVSLTWTASTDNVGVTGYKIYKDGVYLKTVTAASVSVSSLSPGTYSFSVSAMDQAGNESDRSISVPVIIEEIIDIQPPTAPSGLRAEITGTSVILSWNASTDNVGVARYQVYQDGMLAAETTETTVQIDNLQYNTPYTFKTAAVDEAGNTAVSEAVTVIIMEQTAELTVRIIRQSSWNSGFTAEIEIINNTDTAVNSWDFQADFGFTVANSWNSQLSVSGTTHTFTPLNWNSVIQPGTSVKTGFVGSGQLTEQSVSNTILNGNPVSVEFIF